MPCIAVATMSSDTPMRPSVFSPEIQGQEHGYRTFTVKDTLKTIQSLRIQTAVASVSLTQKSSKGDGWRQRGEVDEDDGGHALSVQSISKVTEVLRVAASHVFDQASEKTARTPQGLVARFCWNEGICKMKRWADITTWHKNASQNYKTVTVLLTTCFFTFQRFSKMDASLWADIQSPSKTFFYLYPEVCFIFFHWKSSKWIQRNASRQSSTSEP